MSKTSWQVGYPEGLVRYIDYFRRKYFQYEVFDRVLCNYIEANLASSRGRRLCSLGSGTGRHEIELSRLGFDVIGLERNADSLQIARDYIAQNQANVQIVQCDFMKPEDLENKLQGQAPFDVIALLFIPISTGDYELAIGHLASYLAPGGIFVTDLFGYAAVASTNGKFLLSDVEVADGSVDSSYAVRLNYYEYENDIIQWDAVYLFHDENGILRMARDHDILEVTPEQSGVDPLGLDADQFELLPTYRIIETQDCMNPPHLYNYLIGWRKK